MAHVTKSLMVLDVWVRRKLRGILWRQWKQPRTRYKELVRRGVHPDQARVAVGNGRGPWWNAGAWHMNRAVPNATLRKMGLISLIDVHRRLASPA
jgi:RNA-directed DNA polymerase